MDAMIVGISLIGVNILKVIRNPKTKNNYYVDVEHEIVEMEIYDRYGNLKSSFKFDLSNIDIVKNYKWCFDGQGYVTTSINRNTLYLHKLLMNPKKGYVVDHINGDKSDNRISNLRIATIQENSTNRRKQKNNKSGVIGVTFNKLENKWKSSIIVNKKEIYLGKYENIDDAIKERIKAEKIYFGEFAAQQEIAKGNDS